MVAPSNPHSVSSAEDTMRLLKSETVRRELKAVLRYFFSKYDPDGTNTVDERCVNLVDKAPVLSVTARH